MACRNLKGKFGTLIISMYQFIEITDKADSLSICTHINEIWKVILGWKLIVISHSSKIKNANIKFKSKDYLSKELLDRFETN